MAISTSRAKDQCRSDGRRVGGGFEMRNVRCCVGRGMRAASCGANVKICTPSGSPRARSFRIIQSPLTAFLTITSVVGLAASNRNEAWNVQAPLLRSDRPALRLSSALAKMHSTKSPTQYLCASSLGENASLGFIHVTAYPHNSTARSGRNTCATPARASHLLPTELGSPSSDTR